MPRSRVSYLLPLVLAALAVPSLRAQDAAPPATPADAAAPAPAPPAVTAPSPDDGATRRLTLAEALALAVPASETVQAAAAGTESAGQRIRQASSQRWPQLDASAGYTRTLASEYEDLNFGGSGGSGGTGDGGGDNIDFSQLPFGQKNRWDLGLRASQLLFAGGRIRGQERAARAGLLGARAQEESARAQVLLDVLGAYFDAVLADERLRIAENTLRQGDEILARAKLAFEVGDRSEFDLLRAQVARDNDRPAVFQARERRDVAYLRLKQLLDIPAEETLALAPPADPTAPLPEPIPEAPPAATLLDPASRGPWLDDRTVVREAAAIVATREALADVARAQRWPGLALASDYGRVAYTSNVPSPSDTRTNWTLGFTASVPVFTGGRIRAEIAAADADVANARATLARTRELAWLDARDTLATIESARAVWEASAGTVEQAQRAYDIAALRFREGLSNQLELSDARLLLQQAELNRAAAARDLAVARARLALLPDLPLGQGSVAAAAALSANGGF